VMYDDTDPTIFVCLVEFGGSSFTLLCSAVVLSFARNKTQQPNSLWGGGVDQ